MGTTADGKQPYAIARTDGTPLAFAGAMGRLAQPGRRDAAYFAIVTTSANAVMAVLLERMAVFLEPADWPAWLGEEEGAPAGC
jgi:putative SOS response-associated peptidase YedK